MKKTAPPTDGVAKMRPGIRNILESAFNTVIANAKSLTGSSKHSKFYNPDTVGRYVIATEAAIFNHTASAHNHKCEYSVAVKNVTALLRRPLGIHPDDVGALKVLRGELPVSDLLQLSVEPDESGPRDIIRRMLAATLIKASSVYAEDRERVLADARAIELACYNHVIRTSKLQEDPPRRQWDSDTFRGMYSARCGKINILLDPTSTACQEYGATVIQRLLDGTLLPSELGDASAQTLCPAATATERAEIAARAAQKVEEKRSNLFVCPKCQVRDCVYKEIHTRGPDEAPDYHCRCVCGFRFKGRN